MRGLSSGKAISIPITPALCARVAMMRKWHVKIVDGMILVDDNLRDIRTKARWDTTDPKIIAKHIAKAFNPMLEKDCMHHGSDPNRCCRHPPTRLLSRIKLTLTRLWTLATRASIYQHQQSRLGASAGAPEVETTAA
ncbi:hypothetical protein B0H14DRAFT_2566544 [Mycena olivaceomarginata]|nr:hypothetical protein B0H14DRAFT_2566544 [Mycena olivaceomarginata]